MGFRPFVYRIATENGLTGFIGNDTEGVTIEIEGPRHALDHFLVQLRSETPQLARIDAVALEDLEPIGDAGFRIVTSQVLGQVSTGIPADAATCSDCLRELLDRSDRRYRYPFINCTNCGPRFTITRRIPYDRPQTSMAVFPMCSACQAEYDDPLNRRFHAQPNACWKCGPRVWLASADGAELPTPDPIQACIDRLLGGEVVAIKGIGGFHLSVDARNEEAVLRLRQRKRRYGKPLAVMVRDIAAARALCRIGQEEERLLHAVARPIVLAEARSDNGLAPSVAPGLPWVGVYLPYAPLQHLLFTDPRVQALVMTSGNLSEEPIAIDNDEARERLSGIADVFLLHDREILQRCDDSVSAVVDGGPQIVRRARGYVPLGIELPFHSPPLLAVGGHLKSVFTLARGSFAYQSQHLGDLESLAGVEFFEESLKHFMHTFEIEPQAVVHDLHPGYLSTSWAKEWAGNRGLQLIPVQHHHAHIAACMAEHALEGPVLGLSLDGTGYGVDGRIWGGEVLVASLTGLERFAHLEYVPMPGGDAAVREPWRMAYSALRQAGIDVQRAAQLTATPQEQVRIVEQMIQRGINAPLTSSLGRVFDGVAALVLTRRTVDYEAQAAIELEGLAKDEPFSVRDQRYKLELVEAEDRTNSAIVLKTSNLWRAVVEDVERGVHAQIIAARFHSGIAEGFIGAASMAREKTGISAVAMSGGCMHNRRLSVLLREGLEAKGFMVYRHSQVSPGDGGLSYGQAAIGAAMLLKRNISD